MTYDVIGDLHGHAKELRALLAKLGYEERNGVYIAQGRKAIFVGDFIDRGPAIREALQIARAMVNRDAAHAVLGNHEFNALCYHTADGASSFLRPHSPKNVNQHQATVDQLVVPYPQEWQSYLQWFKDLPLFLVPPRRRAEMKLRKSGRSSSISRRGCASAWRCFTSLPPQTEPRKLETAAP